MSILRNLDRDPTQDVANTLEALEALPEDTEHRHEVTEIFRSWLADGIPQMNPI